MEIALLAISFGLVGIIFAIERLINVLVHGKITFKTENHLLVIITHPKTVEVEQDVEA